jgi:hypothetical protein
MKLQTLKVNNVSPEEFITFWSVQYDYPFDDLYRKNIELDKFDPETLREFFLWKNGMRLSGNKETAFNNIVQHIDVINDLKQNGFTPDVFEQYFGNTATIWKIFLMHIICPSEYPIFDQHVYRAFRFINSLPNEDLPENKIEKSKKYFDEYRPFYQQIQKEANGFSDKVIDEALWGFGKFLSTYHKMLS